MTRVKEGGHNVPEEIIRRRYKRGLHNFFELFLPKLDNWLFVNNSGDKYEIISEGTINEVKIHNFVIWNTIKKKYNDDK